MSIWPTKKPTPSTPVPTPPSKPKLKNNGYESWSDNWEVKVIANKLLHDDGYMAYVWHKPCGGIPSKLLYRATDELAVAAAVMRQDWKCTACFDRWLEDKVRDIR